MSASSVSLLNPGMSGNAGPFSKLNIGTPVSTMSHRPPAWPAPIRGRWTSIAAVDDAITYNAERLQQSRIDELRRRTWTELAAAGNGR